MSFTNPITSINKFVHNFVRNFVCNLYANLCVVCKQNLYGGFASDIRGRLSILILSVNALRLSSTLIGLDFLYFDWQPQKKRLHAMNWA